MKSEKRIIYVDHAATTRVSPTVRDAMLPYFDECYMNPSALYGGARKMKRAIADARGKIATALDCLAEELTFTSCGTESDNWAIRETALAYLAEHGHGGHITVSAFEHHAVLHTAHAMESLGFRVTELLPDRDGIVSPESVERAMEPDTCLVAVMAVNNEIGTVQPIRAIADTVHAHGVPMLCDAVQAIGQIPFSFHECGADFIAVSGHKIHAPKGIGLLYRKKGTALAPLLTGGGQESGARSGTENVPYIIGLAEAITQATAHPTSDRVRSLRDRLLTGLSRIDGIVVNGTMDQNRRVPGNLNVSFPGLSAEALVVLLDIAGICCSAGSACNSHETKPSHVLTSIGADEATATSSLRFSLSEENTEEEMDIIVKTVTETVARLRGVR